MFEKIVNMEILFNIPGIKTPDVLYHYCSTEAFYKIIESKEIWLSDSNYSHDPNENEIVGKILQNEYDKTKGKIKLCIEELILRYNFYRNSFIPYIFCFSELPDDLSQWRYYANDGKGFVLGFNSKHLPNKFIWENAFDPIGFGDEIDDFFIGKVIYEDIEQKRLINNILEGVKFYSNADKEINYTFFVRMLILFSTVFKCHHYKNEKEWRLIRYPVDRMNLSDNNYHSFKFSENAIIPFTRMKINSEVIDNNVFITSVLIGPCNKSNKNQIDQFCLRSFPNWRNNATQKSSIEYLGK